MVDHYGGFFQEEDDEVKPQEPEDLYSLMIGDDNEDDSPPDVAPNKDNSEDLYSLLVGDDDNSDAVAEENPLLAGEIESERLDAYFGFDPDDEEESEPPATFSLLSPEPEMKSYENSYYCEIDEHDCNHCRLADRCLDCNPR